MTTPTRGCKQRLFASARIEDLLGPYLSISATSQSTLSPSDEERRCCVIPRYCASRVSLRADGQRVGVTFKERSEMSTEARSNGPQKARHSRGSHLVRRGSTPEQGAATAVEEAAIGQPSTTLQQQ